MKGADQTVTSLLNEEDWQFETDAYVDGPVLSSSLQEEKRWESYNKWICFPQESVELNCSEVDYNGWHRVPALIAEYFDHRFEFDLFPDTEHECDATLEEWRRMIDGQGEVCVFAAYLQPIEDDASLWYLDRFKTDVGYWVSAESPVEDTSETE